MENLSKIEQRKLKRALQLSPTFFNHTVFGGQFWSKQKQIAESIRDNRYTTARACHDVGKTYIGGRGALWFLYSHPQSIVVTTAPTMRQVENLLWREIRSAHQNPLFPLEGEALKTRLDIAPDWFAIGTSSRDPDKLQGFHAKSGYILIIVDEAAGVPEPAFEAIEGMMTSENARLLMIGNPTSDTGTFRDSHYKWTHANRIHISVFDTPNFVNNGILTLEDLQAVDLDKVEIVNDYLVSPRWAYEKIDAWGIDSPMFQARVLGNFPSQSSNTVIPLNLLEIASSEEHRELIKGKGGDLFLGVDPARFGNDKTVLTPRYGGYIPEQYSYPYTSTTETVGLIKQYVRPNPKMIAIDVDGLGGGVYDILYSEKYDNLVSIHNNGKPLPDDTGLLFANLVSQLWWLARTLFEARELAIPNDDELIMQLSTRKYSFTSRGLTVESKDDWKKRHGGKSCDKADSFIYSLGDILGVQARLQPTTGRNVSELIGRRSRD